MSGRRWICVSAIAVVVVAVAVVAALRPRDDEADPGEVVVEATAALTGTSPAPGETATTPVPTPRPAGTEIDWDDVGIPPDARILPWGDGFVAAAEVDGALLFNTSVDGVVWDDAARLDLPDEVARGYLVSDGRRLVVVGGGLDGDPIGVAVTEDLATWSGVEVVTVPAQPTLPDYVQVTVGESGALADVGPSGVVIAVVRSLRFEEMALMPDWLREQVEAGSGYFVETVDDGIVYGLPEGDHSLYTWDELGVPAELVDLVMGSGDVTTLFTGEPGEGLVVSEVDAGVSFPLSADEGFVAPSVDVTDGSIWFSSDGVEWRGLDRPAETNFFFAWFATVPGGIVASSSGLGRDATFVLELPDGVWSRSDPMPASDGTLTFSGPLFSSVSGVATYVVTAESPLAELDGVEVTVVAQNGYRMVQRIDNATSVLRIEHSDTGEVVAELDFRSLADPPDYIHWDPVAGETAVFHPESGEELFSFTEQDIEAAWEPLEDELGPLPEPGEGPPSTMRLIHSYDGRTWTIIEERLVDGDTYLDMDDPTVPVYLVPGASQLIAVTQSGLVVHDLEHGGS